MRARLAILSSGICCELREVALRDKPDALLRVSPKATVPVMVLPDGRVLEQSLDIMRWALTYHDPQRWLACSSSGQAAIQRCDTEFKHHLDRYKYPNRYGLPNGDEHRDQGAIFLGSIERELANATFLTGDHWGLADAAVVPFVRQWAHTDPLWFSQQPWSALQQWLKTWEASDAFQQVMTKTPTWVAGQPRQWFPHAPS